MDLKRHIRDEPDFPDLGASVPRFHPLPQNGKALQHAVDGLILGGTVVAAVDLVNLAPLLRQERPWNRGLFSLIRHE